MNTKIALSLIALALASACTGLPTYDESSFPAQVVHGAQPAASLAKDVAAK